MVVCLTIVPTQGISGAVSPVSDMLRRGGMVCDRVAVVDQLDVAADCRNRGIRPAVVTGVQRVKGIINALRSIGLLNDKSNAKVRVYILDPVLIIAGRLGRSGPQATVVVEAAPVFLVVDGTSHSASPHVEAIHFYLPSPLAQLHYIVSDQTAFDQTIQYHYPTNNRIVH